MALRYLKEGVLYKPPAIIPTPKIINIPKIIKVFLNAFFSELFLLTNVATNKNPVLTINKIPGSPNTNDGPGLGKTNAVDKIDAVNKTDTSRGFLRLLVRNASTKIKMAIGITKYSPPPHDASARPIINPLNIALGIKNSYFFSLKAEINK